MSMYSLDLHRGRHAVVVGAALALAPNRDVTPPKKKK